jgi:glutathionylspermidine synthase
MRKNISVRPDWISRVEDVGMFYHTIDNKPYWDESVYYEFDAEFIDKLDDATTELHSMCLEYVDSVVRTGDYDSAYDFDDFTKQLIQTSWNKHHLQVYGRFDFGINQNGDIKMFEYNADTPTGLLEASVVQWNWKEEIFPEYDQFNSIHEELKQWWSTYFKDAHIHFSAMKESPYEDWGNVHYLLETANLAGIKTSSLDIESIGWNGNQFVDNNNLPIEFLFKLYPWEWFRNDEFYKNIWSSTTTFIEPPWKMLLSNKLLCAKLWERFRNNKYLLPAFMPAPNMDDYVSGKERWISKPLLGREGQGIKPYDPLNKTDVVQTKFDVINFNGIQPVIGSWVIGNKSAGIGIREDRGVTTNNSRFVPHVFR